MTQKDKQLLIKDLNTRLPYGVTIQYNGDLDMIKEEKDMKHRRQEKCINLKPYDMWTDEDYKNAIPKDVREAYDKAVNNPKVQEQINKTMEGGEQ